MPYDDEIPPGQVEPTPELDRLAHITIGAAIEVHRQLGPGLPEEAYQRAMEVELMLRDIPFERQKIVNVRYKGHWVCRAKIDLLIAGMLVVELKAVDSFTPVFALQVRTYTRLIGQPLGLLINFSVPLLKDGVRRVIHSS